MADVAQGKLLITPVEGGSLSFACNVDKKLDNGIARTSGYLFDATITYFFSSYTRGRLSELEPYVGTNVRQIKNRSGRVQLVSQKPCKFVKCRWEGPRSRIYDAWGDEYRYGEAMGVLTVSQAEMSGSETLALTLWRGDWLYKADGTIERFV